MPSAFDPATREALLARIRFYRDLGLTEFYRRPVDPALLATFESQPVANAAAPSIPRSSAQGVGSHEPQAPSSPQSTGAPGLDSETGESYQLQEESAIAPRKPLTAPPAIPAVIPQKDRAAALALIREEIGDCTRCALHTGRHKIVFGDGSPAARLFFVGEGPGADEDAQGIPFVGKAGQLLNNMIAAMGLKREQVYIANVVKCRPPGNRTPEPDEGNTCSPFLFQQIDVVRPQVIVALGATAATYLLGQRQPLAGLRGRVHAWRGMQLIITYHPAFLLRDPRQKKEAWADLQIAMQELGLKPPAKG